MFRWISIRNLCSNGTETLRYIGPQGVLIALDAGVRETGWAVFSPKAEPVTGVIGLPGRRGMKAPERLSHLIEALDKLVTRWNPEEVAHSQPSGIHWSVPALELLDAALLEWATRHRFPMYGYSAQEVRTAVTGHPNAPKDQLAHDVMVGLGLIGQAKTTHEWEAMAVGHYHLLMLSTGNAPTPTPRSGSK